MKSRVWILLKFDSLIAMDIRRHFDSSSISCSKTLWCLEPGCFLIQRSPRWKFWDTQRYLFRKDGGICSQMFATSLPVSSKILTKVFHFESTERSLSSFRNWETRLLATSRIGEKPRLTVLCWQEGKCTHPQKHNKGNLKRFWPNRLQKTVFIFVTSEVSTLLRLQRFFRTFLAGTNPQL